MSKRPGHGRRRWAFLGAGLLAVAGILPAQAQPADPAVLDLPTILELAGSGSQSAAAAATDLGIAEAEVQRARANWWPAVDLDARYILRDNPIEAQAGDFRFPTAEQASGQYELSARELVYDGGRRALAVTTAERTRDAVRNAGLTGVQRSQLAALDVFLTALELSGRHRVLEQRLTALTAHQKLVGDLYEQGLVARNDVLETDVRLRDVNDQLQAVENRRYVAERTLNRQLGRDPGDAVALPDSLPAPPALALAREELLAAAPRENAAARAASDRLAATRAALALSRRLWVPSVTVGASHAFQENQNLVHEFVNSLSAGVSWNIFDGGVRAADVQQAAARATAAQRDHLEVQRTVTVAVEASWLAWQQAAREERTAETNVDAALENLRIVEDQYQGGLARSSDVLDAETLLATSRFDVVTRHYNTYRAQADLLVDAGRDLVAFYRDAAGVAGEH